VNPAGKGAGNPPDHQDYNFKDELEKMEKHFQLQLDQLKKQIVRSNPTPSPGSTPPHLSSDHRRGLGELRSGTLACNHIPGASAARLVCTERRRSKVPTRLSPF